ncbi:MAG: NUDIX domain-containing protein [Lewinellaceae bacterium]|nr:NUDIX domain-containing protein [Saprospiraceae bacterium]MCB9317306.1 NUDIX domain-containing protein [Lewinellaceae bacterium]MCB9331787.1 NUDIX domain-containing protein [Lewinellaceae bacterium]
MRVVAQCLLEHNSQLLLQEFWHEHDHYYFFRPPGGGIEPGEYAADAMLREIQEELAAEVSKPVLVDVLENIFEYDGQTRHEIVFLFRATVLDERLTSVPEIRFIDNSFEFRAVWIPVAQLLQGDDLVLYPVGLRERLPQLYPEALSV